MCSVRGSVISARTLQLKNLVVAAMALNCIIRKLKIVAFLAVFRRNEKKHSILRLILLLDWAV